jgi:hypothetical protein
VTEDQEKPKSVKTVLVKGISTQPFKKRKFGPTCLRKTRQKKNHQENTFDEEKGVQCFK